MFHVEQNELPAESGFMALGQLNLICGHRLERKEIGLFKLYSIFLF